MESDDLVPAAIFTFPDEAKLARALLQSVGIPSYLENEYALAANWMWTNALGGLRLMVPAPFLDRAREVLGAQISDEDLAAEAEAAGPPAGQGEDPI